MAGYIGKSQGVTQVDGYNRSEADTRYVNTTGDTMTGNLVTPMVVANSALSNRNKIINGAMVIDQRNAGASVSGDGSFAVDRFNSFKNTGTYTGQQSSDAPAGFTKSYLYTNTSATTTTYAAIVQIIEGNNVADLNWGASSAQTVTLSFWVKCSLTGTFGVSLRNSASDRSYVASYTINSADTWEYKTVTIAGDTSGTWLTTNGAGIRVWWDLGVGAGGSTTAGSWQAGNFFGLTGGVKLTETNGATFYITGVQLEAGDTATPFEHRSYGQELALCERYYQLSGGVGRANSTTGADIYCVFKTPMRTTPTATINDGTSSFSQFGRPQANINSISLTFMQTSYSIGCVIVTSDTGLIANIFSVTYGTAFALSAEL